MLCGVSLIVLTLLALSSSSPACNQPPAALAPAPSHPIPRFCGQAIRGGSEVIFLCSDSRSTCEEALSLARQFGAWHELHRVATSCFTRMEL